MPGVGQVYILISTVESLPVHLSGASGLPFYRQIADQVTDLIRAGLLLRGERLPSVRDRAGQLLVSVITVRRAYADLEQDGLIVSRQGKGTFVADDVAPASQARAQKKAKRILREAVIRARRLGMGQGAQLEFLKDLLAHRGYEG